MRIPQNTDKEYLSCGLPEYLRDDIDQYVKGQEALKNGEDYLRYDCDYCALQSSINVAETEQEISSEQAWYLREKYLGLERNHEL